MDIHWKLKASKGRGSFLVSDRDLVMVLGSGIKPRPWARHNAGYIMRTDGGRKNPHAVLLHRVITNAPKGMVVDHINRVKDDNRRSNLRIVTQAENMMNSGNDVAKLRGFWVTKTGRYVAECRGRNLGSFDTAVDAAMRYDQELFAQVGHGANFNFPCAFVGER